MLLRSVVCTYSTDNCSSIWFICNYSFCCVVFPDEEICRHMEQSLNRLIVMCEQALMKLELSLLIMSTISWYILLLVFTTQPHSVLAQYMLWPCVCLSVCPSICLPDTSQYCTIVAKNSMMQTMLHSSHGHLFFWCQGSWWNSNGVSPNGDTKCRWGGLKSAFYQYLAIPQKWR